MKTAFCQKNITPENNVYLAGFANRIQKSDGINDEIFLKAIALEDDKKQRVIIISADILHFDKAMVHRIKYWAKETLNLNFGQIIFNATHTHHAPLLAARTAYPNWDIDIEYVNFFEKSVMQIIEKVNNDLFDAKITYTPAKAHFGINRRLPQDGKICFAPYPDGYYDSDFPVLAIYDSENKLKALLYSYACHPTSGSCGLYKISSDFPGVIAKALQKRCGVDTYYCILQA
jgi:hypothetical protein